VLDPNLSPQLAGLMEHVLKSPWYAEKARVPGYWIGGKTGTAQVWDSASNRWLSNTYNFSCIGFIGRQAGHPDLIVAVRIGTTRPLRNPMGQLILPINATELFRRVATDAITTPGLLPVLDPADSTTAVADR
jgi:cell division protein FtsI/penicillin-binding protein 2